MSKTNPRIFFDLTVGNKWLGRIVMELDKDTVPKTAENFRVLATGESDIGYRGSILYRQCGLIRGGELNSQKKSIYGQRFRDENFSLKHDKCGVVSMANCGPNTNGTEFFIITSAMKHFDERHVAFGKVIRGMNLIRDFNPSSEEKIKITIEDCGQLSPDDDINEIVLDHPILNLQFHRVNVQNLNDRITSIIIPNVTTTAINKWYNADDNKPLTFFASSAKAHTKYWSQTFSIEAGFWARVNYDCHNPAETTLEFKLHLIKWAVEESNDSQDFCYTLDTVVIESSLFCVNDDSNRQTAAFYINKPHIADTPLRHSGWFDIGEDDVGFRISVTQAIKCTPLHNDKWIFHKVDIIFSSIKIINNLFDNINDCGRCENQ